MVALYVISTQGLQSPVERGPQFTGTQETPTPFCRVLEQPIVAIMFQHSRLAMKVRNVPLGLTLHLTPYIYDVAPVLVLTMDAVTFGPERAPR